MTADILFHDNVIYVTGEINFNNADMLFKKSCSFLENVSEWSFDFSKITKTNSILLALLLEWMKKAKHSNKNIFLRNIPSEMLVIAEISGISELITI